MSELATVGIDLAKSVFQIHGVDGNGRVLVRRQLRRSQLLAFFEKRPRCLIGMEACAGSHDWGRRLADGTPNFFMLSRPTERAPRPSARHAHAVGRDLRRQRHGQDHDHEAIPGPAPPAGSAERVYGRPAHKGRSGPG